ncbi:hypothetical protein B0T22DRAFT_455139 [Podospora appendiculata]|uniref:Uncharacterized protein n=1 Tax=Podospora appendiculata TaxID=314037 RepID=A0AAE0XKY2_9PEZI|nr:hypothetical protein B0T22DRAFT_455139 [Podospora appendiculata]
MFPALLLRYLATLGPGPGLRGTMASAKCPGSTRRQANTYLLCLSMPSQCSWEGKRGSRWVPVSDRRSTPESQVLTCSRPQEPGKQESRPNGHLAHRPTTSLQRPAVLACSLASHSTQISRLGDWET